METRARVLEVAAFLDRVQRHGQQDDWRVAELRESLRLLLSDDQGRVARILDSLSDPTLEPIPVATTQGAVGAYRAPVGA
jgi:two-component sensor histidine kinase